MKLYDAGIILLILFGCAAVALIAASQVAGN